MNEERGSVAQQVVHLLKAFGPKDDDELAAVLKRNRIYINQVARGLARQGLLQRVTGSGGKLVNALVPGQETPTLSPSQIRAHRTANREGFLHEDAVKQAVANYLTARGYQVAIMWGRDRGIDIDAVGPEGRIVIEAKGEVPRGPQQVNYFLNALGELVQRMSDEQARYGLALPGNNQFRNLVLRLPTLARQRLRLTVYLVNADGTVEEG
jgi:hypothetical protein